MRSKSVRTSRFFSPAVAVCLLAGAMSITAVAQEGPGAHHFPKPTNLKVLPKNLTGDQVHKIMQGWAGALGQHCNACHAQYADHRKDAKGRPELDFASDANPRKDMARIMVKMTQADKADYITKVKDLDKNRKDPQPAALTCGTCHRGKLDPDEYVPPKHEENRPRGEQRGF